MDKTLSREEAKQLMQLLCLDMSCWGNLPLMRRQYLVKCKEYHPDKGGNEESMKLLNSLYLKLQDSVSSVHDLNEEEDNIWQSSQVYCKDLCCNKFRLVNAIYGEYYEAYIMKQWDVCIHGYNHECQCIHCILSKYHKEKYKIYRKPPVWIECYCYKCYRECFFFPISMQTFFFWKVIIFNTEIRAVQPLLR
nr:small T antigen [KI polyomavirus Stockholm 350]